MIDSYKFNKKDILQSEYLRSSQKQNVVVPSMLRDFTLISEKTQLLEKFDIRVSIYVKRDGGRVSVVTQDVDYVGPTCFSCGYKGNLFMDQLAAEREQNISEHFLTHFLIPFDPSTPYVFLDESQGCYKVEPPNEDQQIKLFCECITRMRLL